jgi:hypothetical protein
MKKKIEQFKKWYCKKFGHKFNDILALMFQIEHTAINKEDFKDETIKCERCKAEFKHKF